MQIPYDLVRVLEQERRGDAARRYHVQQARHATRAPWRLRLGSALIRTGQRLGGVIDPTPARGYEPRAEPCT